MHNNDKENGAFLADGRICPAPLWRQVLLPWLLLVLAVAGVADYAYTAARRAVTADVADDMRAIGRLKTGQIEQWLTGRRDDACLIATAQFVADLQQWLGTGQRNEVLRSRLLAQLKFPQTVYRREVSLLAAEDGRLLLSADRHRDTPSRRALALAAASSGQPVLEDIHLAHGGSISGTDIGLLLPVLADGSGGHRKVLAVLHLSLDPAEWLFPLLQVWPGSSESAETLLLRQEGEELVYLNSLRHSDAPPLRLRLAAATPSLIAAQVASRGEGFYSGKDYRGVASFGYGLPVAGTSWFLVAKLDRREAYLQLHAVAGVSAVLLALLLLFCAWWLVRRRRADSVLRQSFARIEDLYQHAPCGYHSLDVDANIVQINDTELNMLGYRREELVGKVRLPALLTARSQATFSEAYRRFVSSGAAEDVELEFVRKDGAVLPVSISATAMRDARGQYLMSRATVIDVSARRQAEAAQRRLNRTLKLLSDCNALLMRAESEQSLLDAACRMIVDTGSYSMAWIGWLEEDAAKTVRPISSHGDNGGYLDSIRISWGDDPLGQGPTGLAARSGRTQVNQDFRLNPATEPWREQALRCGYKSSIALALTDRQEVFGVLTFYATEAQAFAADEVALLEELTGNLAIGIAALRARAGQKLAEAELLASREELREMAAYEVDGREQERKRIARELHDELGQLLTAAKMDLFALRARLQSAPDLLQRLDETKRLIDTGLTEVRRIAADLRPIMLDELGLKAALEWMAEDFGKRYRGIVCTLRVELGEAPPGDEVTTAAYRIVQECLTNVARHSSARTVEIFVGQGTEAHGGQRLLISVGDDGCGLPPKAQRKGFGLVGIRERVNALAGRFSMESEPGAGVRVAVSLPLSAAREER